jgi:hypothetical protein
MAGRRSTAGVTTEVLEAATYQNCEHLLSRPCFSASAATYQNRENALSQHSGRHLREASLLFSGGRVGVLVKLGVALACAPGGRKRTRGRRSIPTS